MGQKHNDAFNILKHELSSESALAFYDPHKEVQLITDASKHAIGGILLQKGVGIKPICYISRTLTAAELKYSITEKEALALVWAIEKLHLYLYRKNFKVVVDHKPLKFFFSSSSKMHALEDSKSNCRHTIST